MSELIILVVLFIIVMGFFAFVFFTLQKQLTISQEQIKKVAEMLMAGSYQEWKRVEDGQPPLDNSIANEPNAPEITEDRPVSFEEITGVQVDGGPKKPVKIYG